MFDALVIRDMNGDLVGHVLELSNSSADIAVPLGTIMSLDFVWSLADALNAMMAIPNLIALIVLSPIVFSLSKEFFAKQNAQG